MVKTPPKNWSDPEIVTHESFIAAVGPIRDDWERRHAAHDNGCWQENRQGNSSPFYLMLSELSGRSARRIRAHFSNEAPMSLRFADEMLTALDRPDLFHQLDIRPRASLAA